LDRLEGDRAFDIEKALALSTEAITILEAEAPIEERPRFVKELLAGAYLNRGNAIRMRGRGDFEQNLTAARESYRAAVDIARALKNDQLRGTILINTGSASVDRFELSGDKSPLRDAVYSFTEAVEALEQFPRERCYALFRRALIATLTADDSDLDDALKDATTAAEVLKSTGDYESLAAAKSAVGILLDLRSKSN
jgi:hypothetical protein